jgi:hypothetical protein
MKRDMDLIRSVLLHLEEDIKLREKIYSFRNAQDSIAVEGYSDDDVYAHLRMLLDSPFIEGKLMASGGINVRGLTWEGREFLDTIRDPEIWRRTKDGAKKVGGASVDFLWQIAKAYGKHVAKEKLGFDLS